MSFINSYKYEQAKRPKAGPQRCVILNATEGISSKGKQMITITLRVSETETQVKTWLVEGDKFNKSASELFDAFPEIGEGNFNYMTWVGCEGAADFKFDDRGYLALKWFVSADRAKDLPPYVGAKPPRQEITQLAPAELDDTAAYEGAEDEFPFV